MQQSTYQMSHKEDKRGKSTPNQIIEKSTHQETARRRGWRLVTGATGREANLKTHVPEVGTDEGARVLDLGGAEADTILGDGVLDPEGEIGARRIDV